MLFLKNRYVFKKLSEVELQRENGTGRQGLHLLVQYPNTCDIRNCASQEWKLSPHLPPR